MIIEKLGTTFEVQIGDIILAPGQSGMQLNSTAVWVRIDEGPWFRSAERSMMKTIDLIKSAQDPDDLAHAIDSLNEGYSIEVPRMWHGAPEGNMTFTNLKYDEYMQIAAMKERLEKGFSNRDYGIEKAFEGLDKKE